MGSTSSNFDSFRKGSKDDNSLSGGRRGSFSRGRSGYEKYRSWSPESYSASLDNFRPVTLTVKSFFKQVSGFGEINLTALSFILLILRVIRMTNGNLAKNTSHCSLTTCKKDVGLIVRL